MALDLSRRRFFGLLAAPAIVRATSLMPVSAFIEPELLERYTGYASLKAEGHEIVFDPGMARDLLLPGLVGIDQRYPQIPRQWASLFAGGR